MFNLIIAIIAIALISVLAGATLYYGGDAFNSGSTDAKAATFINQAQQIQASATLYKANEGGDPADLAALTADGGYLKNVPAVPYEADGSSTVGQVDWELATMGSVDVVLAVAPIASTADAGVTGDICEKINEKGAGVVYCQSLAGGTDAASSLTAAEALTHGDTVVDVDTHDAVVISMAL